MFIAISIREVTFPTQECEAFVVRLSQPPVKGFTFHSRAIVAAVWKAGVSLSSPLCASRAD